MVLGHLYHGVQHMLSERLGVSLIKMLNHTISSTRECTSYRTMIQDYALCITTRQKTRTTPMWHNTPVDFHAGRHILKGVMS